MDGPKTTVRRGGNQAEVQPCWRNAFEQTSLEGNSPQPGLSSRIPRVLAQLSKTSDKIALRSPDTFHVLRELCCHLKVLFPGWQRYR